MGAEACPVVAWSADFSYGFSFRVCVRAWFQFDAGRKHECPCTLQEEKHLRRRRNIDGLACLGSTVSQPVYPTARGPRSGWPTPFTYMSVRQSQIALLSGVPGVWNEEMNFSCSIEPLLPSASASVFNFGSAAYGGNGYKSHG